MPFLTQEDLLKHNAKRLQEEEVHKALQLIVDNKDNKSLNYAINYARYGLSMTGDMLRVQVLYVLNNITSWRGTIAKEVRNTLKQYVKKGK